MSKRADVIDFQRGILDVVKAEVDSVTDGCEALVMMLSEGKLLRIHADESDEVAGKVFVDSDQRADSADELTQALFAVSALRRDPRVRLQAAARERPCSAGCRVQRVGLGLSERPCRAEGRVQG